MNEVDDNGNEIHGEYDNSKVKIIFFGQGNKIIFKEKIKTKKLDIVCDGNNILYRNRKIVYYKWSYKDFFRL